MAERQGFEKNQTNCPEQLGSSHTQLPTVQEILSLSVVAQGAPTVLAGDTQLDRPVRWVHVSDSRQVAALLNGGELLLSTGEGWDLSTAALNDYVHALVEAGAAGLIVETVHHLRSIPTAMVQACQRHEFPLIMLRHEVKFVSVTEAVHSRILGGWRAALEARDQLHTLFTELSLRGSPADYIVSQIGELLGAPVVLEDLSNHVVALGGPGAGERSILDHWERRSRAAHRDGHDAHQDWLIVPVEARGTRWGYLIALPGAQHPAGRQTVLEQGAVALALSRLADSTDDEWIRRSQHDMLHRLLGRRFSSEGAVRTQLEASGFAVTQRTLCGMALDVAPTAAHIRSAARAADASGAVALVSAHQDAAKSQLVLALSLPATGNIVEVQELLLRTFCGETGHSAVKAAAGDSGHSVAGLLASLEEASELLKQKAGDRSRGGTIYRSEHRPLLRLVTALGADPRLHAQAAELLGPLIDHDLSHNGDLLQVLRAYVTHPGNRTRAAAHSKLSRSVFYQRIELIEGLLGVSLEDGETISALHTALLTRGGWSRESEPSSLNVPPVA